MVKIYYVVENGRSRMMDEFWELDEDKGKIKTLITNMSTVRNFKSPMIRPILKNYSYGEIKPKPHRFFYFQKCGSNYIFFEYANKKKDSLGNDTYQQLEVKKERYAKAFEKFISRS